MWLIKIQNFVTPLRADSYRILKQIFQNLQQLFFALKHLINFQYFPLWEPLGQSTPMDWHPCIAANFDSPLKILISNGE